MHTRDASVKGTGEIPARPVLAWIPCAAGAIAPRGHRGGNVADLAQPPDPVEIDREGRLVGTRCDHERPLLQEQLPQPEDPVALGQPGLIPAKAPGSCI